MANKRTHNTTATDDVVSFEVLTHPVSTDQPKKPKHIIMEVSPLTPSSYLPIIVSVTSTGTDTTKDNIHPSTSRGAAYDESEDDHKKLEVSSEELHEEIDIEETDIKYETEETYGTEDTDDLGYQYIRSEDAEFDDKNEQNVETRAEACVEILDTDKDSDHNEHGISGNSINNSQIMQNKTQSDRSFIAKKCLVHIPTNPIEIFRMFVNDELLSIIVEETNKNGAKKKDWTPTDNSEILTFIGLLLHTGSMGAGCLSDYWSLHYLYEQRVFERYMTRPRFTQILDTLRISDEPDNNTIKAIHPLINMFNGVMKRTYNPGQYLIIDNIATFHYGNLVSQELRTLRAIKKSTQVCSMHALAETESGIVYQLAVFKGLPDKNKIVEYLLRNKLNQGNTVYLNEYYMNFDIAHQLLLKGTYSTGPIPTSLRYATFPKNMKDESEEATCQALRDKGLIVYNSNNEYFLSSELDTSKETGPATPGDWYSLAKPVCQYWLAMRTDYNTTAMTYYPCRDISLSWNKKVLIHVLQVALQNSFKMSTFTQFVQFRATLLESLLPPTENLPQNQRHFLRVITKTRPRMRRRKNGQLSTTHEVHRKVCRGCDPQTGQKHKFTKYECLQCPGQPGFCPPCFERMHSDFN